jgi:hypothetical protein
LPASFYSLPAAAQRRVTSPAPSAIGGAASAFDPTTRVVRRWKTVTTSDGRTIQVPDDILVDRNGNPVLPARPVKKQEQKKLQPDNNLAP